MENYYKEIRSHFFDEAETLFSIWDNDLNFVDANKALFDALQIKKEQLIGQNLSTMTPDTVSSGRYEIYKKVLETGKTAIIDEVKIHPDVTKSTQYYRVKIFKMKFGIGVISKNITDLKIIINDDIQKLQEQASLLQYQNTQLSDFCNIISHNLRAPLVNLGMLTDFIAESNSYEESKELTSKLKPVIEGLNETFDYLIETLQIRLDKEIRMDQINLEESANKILKEFEPEKEVSNANVKINFESFPEIKYPRKYIDSILTNLISNAFKYRSPNRNLELNLRTIVRQGKVLLVVKDNGLGIDLNMHHDRIFKVRKVFHKHPQARGFGLFMIKNQIESMGDSINIKSEINRGSTFYIEFKNQKNDAKEISIGR
jgi:signal transduction histidine kinase